MPVFSSLTSADTVGQIGGRFRAERQRHNLTLRDVAGKCGIGIARLSEIENGVRTPTLEQAERIAAALGMAVGAFFPAEQSDPYQVVRAAELRDAAARTAVLVRRDGGRRDHHNLFRPLADQFVGRQMEPLLGSIPSVADADMCICRHHDFEFVSVLKGAVEFVIDTPRGRSREELRAGDSVFFRSSIGHCIRSLEPTPAETLHVLSSATSPAETAWDWFSAHAAAYLDEPASVNGRNVATELRLLRVARQWTIDEVARLIGTSKRQLEQFENGNRSITLDKIVRLGRLFGRPLHTLLRADGDDEQPCYFVQRRADVTRTPPRTRRAAIGSAGRPRHVFYRLADPLADSRMYPYLVRMENLPTADVPLHEHHGQQFLYVLDGHVEMTIGVGDAAARHVLGPGDACYLDSSVPHAVRGETRNPYSAAAAEAIAVFWCPLGEQYFLTD